MPGTFEILDWMGEMTAQDKKLEKQILALVKSKTAMPKIVAQLRTKHMESSVRRMVWRLIDRGDVRVTSDLKFTAQQNRSTP